MGWVGQSEKAKSVAIKGGQKGELLERGGNVGDIASGGKKVACKKMRKDTGNLHKLFTESTTLLWQRYELLDCFKLFAPHLG